MRTLKRKPAIQIGGSTFPWRSASEPGPCELHADRPPTAARGAQRSGARAILRKGLRFLDAPQDRERRYSEARPAACEEPSREGQRETRALGSLGAAVDSVGAGQVARVRSREHHFKATPGWVFGVLAPSGSAGTLLTVLVLYLVGGI